MPHRLRAGDTDEHVVEQRASNQGPIGKTKSFMHEWGWALSALTFILLALGFKYVTPADQINGMKKDITELKDVTRVQAQDISTIVRLQCFNENYTTKQLNLVGIHCDGIR